MNTLLIFFAFPIAVIIFSAILQKLLKNSIAVASIVFAIFIIITFAAFDETFLIATLAYTILAFITAVLVSRLCCSKNNSHTNDILESILDLLQNSNISSDEINEEDNDNVINQNTGCTMRRRYRRY